MPRLKEAGNTEIRESVSTIMSVAKDKALYLLIIGALATLFFDVRYEHRDVLGERWEAYIPLVMACLGIIGCVLALLKWRPGRIISSILFAALTITGALGVYYHTGFKAAPFESLISGQPVKGSGFSERPAVAPLAFLGFGALGLILNLPTFPWPRHSRGEAVTGGAEKTEAA